MQFPINDIHFFIGFPVLLGLSIDTYLKYRKSKNPTTLLIALASFFLSAALITWSLPTLFTDDTKVLSFFTFIADSLQAMMFLMIWILVIRGYIFNKTLKALAYIGATTLAVVAVADAALRNLRPPYSTTLESLSSGTYDIVFAESMSYTIITALNSISLLLIGFYFWRSGNSSTDSAQRFRIKSLALAFLLTSIIYIALPAVGFDTNIDITDIALTAIFSILAISGITSFVINRLNRNKLSAN